MEYVVMAIAAILFLSMVPSWLWSIVGYIIMFVVIGFIVWWLSCIGRRKEYDEVISVEDLYNFYTSSGFTALQREDVWNRKFKDRIFIGEGSVVSVDYIDEFWEKDQSRWERDEDGDLYNPSTRYDAKISVVVDPAPKKFEKYYLWFRKSSKKDLLAVKVGDHIKFKTSISSQPDSSQLHFLDYSHLIKE